MKRIGLHAGWLGGLVFHAALLVVGALAIGYLPARQPVSVLGMAGAELAPWWNVLGLVVPGLLIGIFALSLATLWQRPDVPASARIGAWLLLICGLAFAATGVYVYDGAQPESTASKLHVALLAIALLSFLPAMLAMALGLRGKPQWRRLVVAGPLFALLIGASVIQRAWDFVPWLQGHPGAAQRITLALCFAWLVLAAVTALRATTMPRSRSRRLGQ